MNNQPNIRKIILFGVLLFVGFMILSTAYWLYQHGNLAITVTNHNGQAVDYKLVQQSSGEELVIKANEGQKTIRLNKGSYDVFVKEGELESYAIGSVGGWLGTTKLNMEVSQQFGRQFVASDSGSCIRETENYLLSYNCEGPISQFRTHLSGTESVPPYVYRFPNTGIVGTIESTLESPNGAYVMVSLPISSLDDESFDDTHALFKITGTSTRAVDQNPSVILDTLNPSKKYYAVNYRDGFVVYDVTFDEVYYYESFQPDSEPTKITNFVNDDKKLTFSNVFVDDNNLLVLYATDAEENKNGKSVLIIGNESQTKTYKFPKAYFKVSKCGDTNICLVHKGGMDVYNISNGKPELQFTAGTVTNFYTINKQLFVLADKMIYLFDLNSLQGKPVYNTDGISLVSLHANTAGFLANIKRGDSSFVLQLDASITNDNIDSKLFELTNNSTIRYVSSYKDKIYISPNVGELVYDNATNVFAYDLQRRQRAAQELPGIVESAGIDLSRYKLVNTLP